MKILLEDKVWKQSVINMPTSITSTLIKEAAKCSNYASDLFIDYANIRSHLIAWDLKALRSHYLFGFRSLGVDAEQMILAAQRDYRAIYMLTLTPHLDPGEDEYILFTLSKLGANDKPEASTDMLSKLSEGELEALRIWIGNFPTDRETGEITDNFLGFPAGTRKAEICEWFKTLLQSRAMAF